MTFKPKSVFARLPGEDLTRLLSSDYDEGFRAGQNAERENSREFLRIIEIIAAQDCWETDHSLGGIDDCYPCLCFRALREYQEKMK